MSQSVFTNLINHTFRSTVDEIKWSLDYNQGFTFDTGKFGERVLFIVENTRGVPSNGGCAFDSEKKSEAKCCFTAQTYICTDCNSKNNYYSDTCYKCGGTDRKDPGDSRWGIDATAHFTYKDEIPCYIFTHVEPLNKDAENPQYRIRVFRINSDNKMFNDILKHQVNAGKKAHKNFMPFKRDFYMCSPIPLVDCTIDITDSKVIVDYDLYCPDNQDGLTRLPVDIFTKSERKLLTSTDNNYSLIEEAIKKFGVKNSTHGKERGKLDRNKNL